MTLRELVPTVIVIALVALIVTLVVVRNRRER